MKKIGLVIICVIAVSLNAISGAFSTETISLPDPKLEGGVPIYEALKTRATHRSFSTKELSTQQLSQILWSAAGVNRENPEKRTAPTAWGNNEITLYVLLKSGTYTYSPVEHKLITVSKIDNRSLSGTQGFVKDAPVSVILVADLSKISQTEIETEKIALSQIDAGYVSQNLYLAAGCEGLVTGARASIDKEKLKIALMLNENQKIILAHSIGFIKK